MGSRVWGFGLRAQGLKNGFTVAFVVLSPKYGCHAGVARALTCNEGSCKRSVGGISSTEDLNGLNRVYFHISIFRLYRGFREQYNRFYAGLDRVRKGFAG